MGRKCRIYYLIILQFLFNTTIVASNAKEMEKAFKRSDFSIFFYQNDSIYNSNYQKIKRLYKRKEYIVALSKALDLYDDSKKEGMIKYSYLSASLVADIYDKTNDYQKSLDYYKESLSILIKEKLESSTHLNEFSNVEYAKTLLRIGSSFQKMSKNDSAKYYYNRLEQLSSLNNTILSYKAVSHTNLSGIYELDSIYDKAEEYALKAIDIHKNRGDMVNQANAFNNLGNIYLSQENYEKAKSIYLTGINLIEKNNSQTAVKFKANLYYNLAWAMRNLKEYEAYDYQEKSYLIEDRQRDVEFKRMIETVTAKHNVDRVKKAEEIKLLKQKDKTWGVTVLSISILIVLIGTVAYFKFRQKNMSLKLSRNELIQQQKIEKLKSESQIRILNATIDGKESERKQIAETLHDSVSTLLSSANLHLQACRSQFNGSTPVEIEKSQKIITEASDKIRDLSHTLVSSVLLKFGLQYSLKDMADKYSNSQIEIRTDISDLRRYDQSFEIKTYNIIQEFINNILKHSKATKAELTLFEKDQKLILAINDNGQGFDKNLIPEKDGLGINQIDARIKMMQGKFTIESSKGNGTKIEVELPIHEREAVTLA